MGLRLGAAPAASGLLLLAAMAGRRAGRWWPGPLAEPQRLMRAGLGLIVLGHSTLVLGAIVHGSVLRHVSRTKGAVTPEYAVANVVSVLSGLLVRAVRCGWTPCWARGGGGG